MRCSCISPQKSTFSVSGLSNPLSLVVPAALPSITGYCATCHLHWRLLLRAFPQAASLSLVARLNYCDTWRGSSPVMAPLFIPAFFYQHNRALMKYYNPSAPALCFTESVKETNHWSIGLKWCSKLKHVSKKVWITRGYRELSSSVVVGRSSFHIKCLLGGSCHVKLVVGGDIFNLLNVIAHTVCFLFLEMERRVGETSSCDASQLHFAIYNAFYTPLLCKRGMMKRVSSLRNGIVAAPPPPLCAGKVLLEVQLRTGEENPLHSNLVELTYLAFLYFMSLFSCSRGGCCRGSFRAVKPEYGVILPPCKPRILSEQKLHTLPL